MLSKIWSFAQSLTRKQWVVVAGSMAIGAALFFVTMYIFDPTYRSKLRFFENPNPVDASQFRDWNSCVIGSLDEQARQALDRCSDAHPMITRGLR